MPPAPKAKQQRRAEQLAKRKEEKKLLKTLKQQGLSLPGSSAAAAAAAAEGGLPLGALPEPRDGAAPFFGGMRMVGSRYPVEVPLKLFFPEAPDDDETTSTNTTNEETPGAAEAKAVGPADGATSAPLPRPPLGNTTIVHAGWSNMSTQGFLSKACVLDPRTNALRWGLEIRGPPVQVGSHMGAFESPGLVAVKVQSPEMLEKGVGPVAMEFLVYEGTRGVKEGMLGNEELVMLGVTEPMRHRTG